MAGIDVVAETRAETNADSWEGSITDNDVARQILDEAAALTNSHARMVLMEERMMWEPHELRAEGASGA